MGRIATKVAAFATNVDNLPPTDLIPNVSVADALLPKCLVNKESLAAIAKVDQWHKKVYCPFVIVCILNGCIVCFRAPPHALSLTSPFPLSFARNFTIRSSQNTPLLSKHSTVKAIYNKGPDQEPACQTAY